MQILGIDKKSNIIASYCYLIFSFLSIQVVCAVKRTTPIATCERPRNEVASTTAFHFSIVIAMETNPTWSFFFSRNLLVQRSLLRKPVFQHAHMRSSVIKEIKELKRPAYDHISNN